MRIPAAEIANAPPRGATLTRPVGYRFASGAPSDRVIEFIASDPSVARDGHRILADAWQLDNFLANPVFLWAHCDHEPPVGRVISVRTVGSQLRASVRFADPDVYDFAETIYQLYRQSFLNAVSVGFLPLAWKQPQDSSRPGGVDFTEVELLELSGVPIPALPTAVATARAAGVDVTPLAAWAERALDRRNSSLTERELTMIRSAATAGRVPAAPRRSMAERLAERQRAARPGADPASGFRSFGEFLQAVARASTPATADARLVRTPFPSGASESDPIAGGYTVPITFIDRLVASIYDDSVIAPLCEQIETENPSRAKMPGVEEKSRADGSRWGGATAYWVEEAESVTTSLAKWRAIEFVSNKLMAVCVATRELLEDAPMLEAYVHKAFGAERGFKIDQAILSGGGNGVPLGLLNESPSSPFRRLTGSKAGPSYPKTSSRCGRGCRPHAAGGRFGWSTKMSTISCRKSVRGA